MQVCSVVRVQPTTKAPMEEVERLVEVARRLVTRLATTQTCKDLAWLLLECTHSNLGDQLVIHINCRQTAWMNSCLRNIPLGNRRILGDKHKEVFTSNSRIINMECREMVFKTVVKPIIQLICSPHPTQVKIQIICVKILLITVQTSTWVATSVQGPQRTTTTPHKMEWYRCNLSQTTICHQWRNNPEVGNTTQLVMTALIQQLPTLTWATDMQNSWRHRTSQDFKMDKDIATWLVGQAETPAEAEDLPLGRNTDKLITVKEISKKLEEVWLC